MTHVLCLIAAPGALDPALVARLRVSLPGTAETWLAPAEACDLGPVAGDPAVLARAREALCAAPVDVNLIERSRRRKALLVADMESTLIENEMIDELADTVGIGAEVARITFRTMNGELDFATALRERVALLAGLPVQRLETVAERIRLMSGASCLIATLRAHGVFTAIVSGGFLFFTNLVRRRLGADHDEGNDLVIMNGALTGTVRDPILDRDGKVLALRRLAAKLDIGVSDALTVGDGANDLPMLRVAGLGVAFRAKPAIAAAAPVKVTHGDLTALLFLQGYPRTAFVTSA